MKKPKKAKRSKPKQLKGEQLCACYECGQQVLVTFKRGHPEGLAHPPLKEKTFGPNGETGCKAFDAIGDSGPNDWAAYVAACRQNLETENQN